MSHSWVYPGKIKKVYQDKNNIIFDAENCRIEFRILKPDIFQVRMLREGQKAKDSFAIYKENWPQVDYIIHQNQEIVEINTGKLILCIELNPYSLKVFNLDNNLISADFDEKGLGYKKDGLEVRTTQCLNPSDKIYGLGERCGFLNKRGEYHELWNFDQGEAHVHSTLHMYKSIPFFVVMREFSAYGIFVDNTYLTRYDFGKESENYFYFEADGGILNYYFIYGPEIKTVIKNYTEITGRIELPPLWALGFHQSRYSYYPDEKVYEIAETFRHKNIPCDVIHLDIDYMEGYRVFTWDKEKFPEPQKMLADLREKGFKVVTIVDPGVKIDSEYPIYLEGLNGDYYCKDPEGDYVVGEVWPGECVFPDFSLPKAREWWAEKNKNFVKQGIAGIWNDMNEPALLKGSTKTLPLETVHKGDGEEITHAEFHNLYGTYMSLSTKAGLLKARPDERPFILTRAAYAGIQRVAAVWTGDNRSYWEHLALSIPMLTTLGLSGVTFAGADIGGFGFDTTPELFTRWLQVGICYPFCRVHSAINSKNQEPWSLGKDVEEISRKYINLRYRLLPYIYNLFYQASLDGIPVMRPLLIDFQNDEKVHNLNDQFMLGDSILVAAILTPGVDCRAVYLPQGEWYDFYTGEKYEGKKWVMAKAPLDIMPMFIKAGAIIPMGPEMNYVGEKAIEELNLLIYPGPASVYSYYEDDGLTFAYREGGYNLTSFEVNYFAEKIEVKITPIHQGYDSSIKNYKLIFKNSNHLQKIFVNQKPVTIEAQGNDLIINVSPDLIEK